MFVWEKTARILELSDKFIRKQTSCAEQQATQAGDNVFRNTVDPRCFELVNSK